MVINFDFLYEVFYYFIFYSFLGWITEVIYAYYKKRHFINRGFLYGPFCPIYGFGVVFVHLFLVNITKSKNFVNEISAFQMFIWVVVITTILEYLTGFLLEKIFHTKWWDYSKRKFNVNGYICLKFSIVWGIAGTFLLRGPHRIIGNIIKNIPNNVGIPIMYLLLTYIVLDGIYTIHSLFNFRNILIELHQLSYEIKTNIAEATIVLEDQREVMVHKLKDRVEEFMDEIEDRKEYILENIEERKKVFSDKVEVTKDNLRSKIISKNQKQIIRYQDLYKKLYNSHLFNAFPDMESKKYSTVIDKLKKRLYKKAGK